MSRARNLNSVRFVFCRLRNVDPAPEDPNARPAGLQHPLVGRRVHSEGQPADDAHPAFAEIPSLLTYAAAVRCAPEHRWPEVCIPLGRPGAYPKQWCGHTNHERGLVGDEGGRRR
jgi:hypothetical protein